MPSCCRPMVTERCANLPGSACTYTIGSFLSSRSTAATGTPRLLFSPTRIAISTNMSFFRSPSGFSVTTRTGVVRVAGSTNAPT